MKASVIRILCLGLFCTFAGAAFGQVPEQERQALIDFYQASGGDHWIDNDGWLGEAGSECEWFGVSCHTSDEAITSVRTLDLSKNGLTGSLPDSLLDLARLVELRLDGNAIEGPILASFGGMPELARLKLAGNRLSGPVPGELVGLFGRLDLRRNQLDGYTEAVGTPTTGVSRFMLLGGNPIRTLPPQSWRSSGAISHLELDRTALSGELDFEMHPWPGLQTLDLSGNAITSLSGIDSGTLENLLRLYLNDNKIDQWPVSGQTLTRLGVLDLTANNLHEPPPAGLSNHPKLWGLYLGRNSLEGQMLGELFSMPGLWYLELHHNPLNALPAAPASPSSPVRLDLSHAGLEGPPPAWFADMTLANLNVAGNRLGGEIDPWLAGMRESRIRLNLSNNRFDGPIPETLADLDFAANGLDLCWNDFDEPFGSELDALFDEVHHGGHPGNCNQRQLEDIDPTISGSWYHPGRDGEGYTIMLLDNGLLLHYWFGYPSPFTGGWQKWAFQLVRPKSAAAAYPVSLAPYGGRFGYGLGSGHIEDHDTQEVDMVRLTGNKLGVRVDLQPFPPNVIIDPPPPSFHERFIHTRLTHLAGTACDSEQPHQWISGAWYNPDADGEGFIVEVLDNGRGVVYWFTYQPDQSGHQAWMMGDGDFDGDTLIIDNLVQPTGTRFGPDFDPDEVEFTHWGSLVMEFDNDLDGHIWFDSVDEDYGSGDYPIERLARAKLAECD